MGTILTGTDEERKEFQRTPPFAFLESRSVIPPLPCVNKRGNWHTKKGLLKSHHQLVVKSDQQPVLSILSQRLYNRTCPYYSEYVPGSNPRKLQALWGQKPISHQPWHSLVPSISRKRTAREFRVTLAPSSLRFSGHTRCQAAGIALRLGRSATHGD